LKLLLRLHVQCTQFSSPLLWTDCVEEVGKERRECPNPRTSEQNKTEGFVTATDCLVLSGELRHIWTITNILDIG